MNLRQTIIPTISINSKKILVDKYVKVINDLHSKKILYVLERLGYTWVGRIIDPEKDYNDIKRINFETNKRVSRCKIFCFECDSLCDGPFVNVECEVRNFRQIKLKPSHK